ncbi:MAG: LicD family protein [Acutalibacteraceae bacterium]|nr:LicD family protein [Acutalibacteraceae bacterium]
MRYHIENNFKIIEELPVSQIRVLEVDMLRAFINLCNENGLKYFIEGGTLIGAVRHQGFVPWDDDMDVSMPRADFEKFRELTKSGYLGEYEVRSYVRTPEVHPRPFDRIVDPRYMTSTKVEQPYMPPWLDVHAKDGLPSNDVENWRHWNEIGKLKKASRICRTPFSATKGILRRTWNRLTLWPYKLRGPEYYAQKIEELSKKYDFDNSEYIATVMAGYGRKERMPKYWYTDGEKQLYFEGILCSVPPHYDLVLKHMYGDYLRLPSNESKATHVKKLWRVIPKKREAKEDVR